MNILIFSCMVLSMNASSKQSGTPFIVINPDTLVTQTEGSSSLSGAGSQMSRIITLEGGHFGVGIIDLSSGESMSRSESGRFFMGMPNVITGTCGIDLSSTGEFPLDSIVAREETLWQLLRRAQQGGREASQRPFFDIGLGRMNSWLDSKGLVDTEIIGVQLVWEGAPVVEENLTTVDDCLQLLEIVYRNLDVPAVRRIVMNPDLGDAIEASIESGSTVYGWISTGEEHRDITVIVLTPQGEKFGLVVLADNLCCAAKADLAFTQLLESVTD